MRSILAGASLVLLGAVGGTGAAARHWTVAVLGAAGDPSLPAVAEAVEYWNEHLASVSANLRLGPMSRSDQQIPDGVLRAVSEAVLRGSRPVPLPPQLQDIDGEIIVVLSNVDLISVGIPPAGSRKGVAIIRRADVPPLSLPNVARNVIAHELGHVLELRHNGDPATLMCGRPAPCRPSLFQSDHKVFFPLAETDRRELAARFR